MVVLVGNLDEAGPNKHVPKTSWHLARKHKKSIQKLHLKDPQEFHAKSKNWRDLGPGKKSFEAGPQGMI